MYFESLAAAWHMDGHGGYVWMAYALTTMAVVLMVWLPLARFRRRNRASGNQTINTTAIVVSA